MPSSLPDLPIHSVAAVLADLGLPEAGMRGALRYARRAAVAQRRVREALRALQRREDYRQSARAGMALSTGAALVERGEAGAPPLQALQRLQGAQQALDAASQARATHDEAVAQKNSGAHETLARRSAARQEAADIRTRLEARLHKADEQRQALRVTIESLRAGDAAARASAAEQGPNLEALERDVHDLRTKRGEADAREAAARGAEAQARAALEVLEGGDRAARQRLEQAVQAQERAVEQARATLDVEVVSAGRRWLDDGKAAVALAEWQTLTQQTAEDEALAAAYREVLAQVDRKTQRRGLAWRAALWGLPFVALVATVAALMTARGGKPAHGAAAPPVPSWARSSSPELDALADRILPRDAAAYAGVEVRRLGALQPLVERFALLPPDLERVVAAGDDADSWLVFAGPSRLPGVTAQLKDDTLAGKPAFRGPKYLVVPAEDGVYVGNGARLEGTLATAVEAAAWRQSALVDSVAPYLPAGAPLWGFVSQSLLGSFNAELDTLPLPRAVRRTLRRVVAAGVSVFVADGLFGVVAADLGSAELAESTRAQLEALVTGGVNRATVLGVPSAVLERSLTLRVDGQIMVLELSLQPADLAELLRGLQP